MEPMRVAVTALAPAAAPTPPAPSPEPPAAEPAHRRAARYTWALLLARICEVFPLVCPHCGGAMRIIAFFTDGPTGRDLLAHLGAPTAPPRIAPARGCLGVSARAKVQRQACGAARYHQKSTLDPPYCPHHNQARAIDMRVL
jgi:hypothetical protein